MKRFGVGTLGVLLFLLVSCGGSPLTPLTVELVDGLAQPLLPIAAAWHAGPPPSTSSSPWIGLPTSQSSWTLPTLPNTRFQVAFLCPGTGSTQFYVSLDLRRSELGSHIRVRCPRVYASPPGTANGALLNSPSLTGWVASEDNLFPLSNSTTYGPMTILQSNPPGNSREIAVYGEDSSSNPYFSRSTPLTLGAANAVNLSPSLVTDSLSVTTALGFSSRASLILGLVQLPLKQWGPGPPTTVSIARPPLGGGDYFEFYMGHGNTHALWRYDQADPAVAPSSTLTLSVPPLNISGSQTHTFSTLPTFSNIASSGFSPGLTFVGYALLLSEPGIRYWRHFVSAGALGMSTTYHLDLQTAPGFSGVVPSSGSNVELRVSAFAGAQPSGISGNILANLLGAKPLPTETIPGHSLFLDRAWPFHLEVATLQSNFIW